MPKPIKSELSVASTKEVKASVEQDLEEIDDVDLKDISQYMRSTGGTRAYRLVEARRLWEQDQTKKKKPQS